MTISTTLGKIKPEEKESIMRQVEYLMQENADISRDDAIIIATLGQVFGNAYTGDNALIIADAIATIID